MTLVGEVGGVQVYQSTRTDGTHRLVLHVADRGLSMAEARMLGQLLCKASEVHLQRH